MCYIVLNAAMYMRIEGPVLAEVHLVVGVAVLALNLVAGAWGLPPLRWRRASVSFWYVLRAAQASVIVQVLLGALLLIDGREPTEDIHYMYGAAPLAGQHVRRGHAGQRRPAGGG